MYEARQNKEKVSRRIENNETLQRIKFKNNRNINIIQLLSSSQLVPPYTVIQLGRNKNIAKQPTIESIKEAFPILGSQIEKEYGKIKHDLPQGTSVSILQETFQRRLHVMTLFRMVMLANGINGASRAENQRFISQERGHIEALILLKKRINPEEDENEIRHDIENKLKSVRINANQIK